MPNNDVPTPNAASAVDRLSLSSTSVRGTVPNVFGSAAHSCACFDAEPQQTSTYGAWNGICFDQ